MRPGERETPPPAAAQAPAPTPQPANPSATSLEAPLAAPPTLSLSPDEVDEEELLDSGDGDGDGLGDTDVAPPATSDEEEEEKMADLATGLASPPAGASLDSAPSTPRSGASPDAAAVALSIPPPSAPGLGAPGRAGAAAPARLKSVLFQPDAPRKTVWQRVDLTRPSPASSLALMAPSSKTPATPTGKARGARWELGEPSRVNEVPDTLLSPEWQKAKKKRWRRVDSVPHQEDAVNKLETKGEAEAARETFKRQLAGRCFRCLASDHRIAHCRDPCAASRAGLLDTFPIRAQIAAHAPSPPNSEAS